MITVRFPNGNAIQYNNMNFLWHADNGTFRLGENNSHPQVFIQASAGAIVEFCGPCRVFNSVNDDQLVGIQRSVDLLRKKIVLKSKRPLTKSTKGK